MSLAWVKDLQQLWEPPPDLGGWEWADTFRVLGPDESADPGPWRSLGWQKYFLELLADPSVDWVVCLKAAQMGISELVRCAIGRWALLDPGDVLWVMSAELPATKAMEKLKAMFRNTPALQHLLPAPGGQRGRRRKNSINELILTNGMRIVIGWAGSPASLASDPFPRVILDETGLYPSKVGKEGSPIGLAEERTKTFGRRRKIVLLSKPAHADDLICTAHDECLDKRQRHLPCPECGELAPLEWERVRWLDSEGCEQSAATSPSDPTLRILLAAHVERTQSAWIECPSCLGKLRDVRGADEDPRAAWVRTTPGEPARRRAVHLDELYHWSRSTSDLVARYLRAVKPGDVQNFFTGSLGRPYEQERGSLTAALFERKAVHKAGVIPAWATALVSAADTQKDHWWFVTRAWGPGGRSRLIDFGRVETTDELRERALERRWPIEGSDKTASAVLLVVDAGGGTAGGSLEGSRSQVVYDFAATTPHVRALKGSGAKKGAQEGKPITFTVIRFGDDKEKQVELVQPHANYWKDQTAALCRSDSWEETTQAADPVYLQQMCGQRQVYEQLASGEGKWVWRKRRGRPDHLWDCSYMCVVGAELLVAGDRESIREIAQQQTRERQLYADDEDDEDDWLDPYTDGW